MKEVPFSFRFVEVRGVRYLRLDDVATFLHELGGAEETDVRKSRRPATRTRGALHEALRSWRGTVVPR